MGKQANSLPSFPIHQGSRTQDKRKSKTTTTHTHASKSHKAEESRRRRWRCMWLEHKRYLKSPRGQRQNYIPGVISYNFQEKKAHHETDQTKEIDEEIRHHHHHYHIDKTDRQTSREDRGHETNVRMMTAMTNNLRKFIPEAPGSKKTKKINNK